MASAINFHSKLPSRLFEEEKLCLHWIEMCVAIAARDGSRAVPSSIATRESSKFIFELKYSQI